jgi:hypothetical protein
LLPFSDVVPAHSFVVDYVSVISDGNARVRVRGVHHPCEHVLTPVPAYELQYIYVQIPIPSVVVLCPFRASL